MRLERSGRGVVKAAAHGCCSCWRSRLAVAAAALVSTHTLTAPALLYNPARQPTPLLHSYEADLLKWFDRLLGDLRKRVDANSRRLETIETPAITVSVVRVHCAAAPLPPPPQLAPPGVHAGWMDGSPAQPPAQLPTACPPAPAG